jgi:hypothetical protein
MSFDVGMASPAEAKVTMGPYSFDLKGSMRSFFEELTRLVRDYGDPEKDVVIDGMLIKAEDKYSPYGTLVFNTKVSTLEQVQTTLLNVYDSIFKLEKSLTGLS